MNQTCTRATLVLILVLACAIDVGCGGGQTSRGPVQPPNQRESFGPPPQGYQPSPAYDPRPYPPVQRVPGQARFPASPTSYRDVPAENQPVDYGGPSYGHLVDPNARFSAPPETQQSAAPVNSEDAPSFSALETASELTSRNDATSTELPRTVTPSTGDSTRSVPAQIPLTQLLASIPIDETSIQPRSETGPLTPTKPLVEMGLIDQFTGGGSHPKSYCGPTSVRMILGYYGMQAPPDEVALTDFGSGKMYIGDVGSTYVGMNQALRHYGLKTEMKTVRNLETVKAAVAKGHPVIIGLHGNYGPFYTGGHIAVVIGFTASGDPIIADPAYGKRRTIPRRTFLNCWGGYTIEAWK